MIVIALCVLLCCNAAVALFQCQSTLDVYNAHVNVGNFTGAAALTFADNVTYFIPGSRPQCPYCDTYRGRARVVSLFVDGFLGHFASKPEFCSVKVAFHQA